MTSPVSNKPRLTGEEFQALFTNQTPSSPPPTDLSQPPKEDSFKVPTDSFRPFPIPSDSSKTASQRPSDKVLAERATVYSRGENGLPIPCFNSLLGSTSNLWELKHMEIPQLVEHLPNPEKETFDIPEAIKALLVLVFRVEEKNQALVNEHKTLSQDFKKLEKEYRNLRGAHHALKSEHNAHTECLEDLSTGHAVLADAGDIQNKINLDLDVRTLVLERGQDALVGKVKALEQEVEALKKR